MITAAPLAISYTPLPTGRTQTAYRAAWIELIGIAMFASQPEPEIVISQLLREDFIAFISALPDSFFDLPLEQRRQYLEPVRSLVIDGIRDIDYLSNLVVISMTEKQSSESIAGN